MYLKLFLIDNNDAYHSLPYFITALL